MKHTLGLFAVICEFAILPAQAIAQTSSATGRSPTASSGESAITHPGPASQPASKSDEDTAGHLDDLDLMKLLNVEVSTATKTSESLDDAPAVITVVTREDIQRWGYRSVAEVLNHTVGFYSIDDYMLPNVGVRGMTGGLGAESSVIKVMIDGRSVAYRTTSGNWLGVELIPLQSVAQIEIIRGPASALYGADAFLGVVNIITEKPENGRHLRARASVGHSGGQPGGVLDAVSSVRMGKFDLLLGAAGEYADRSGVVLPPESPAPTLPSWVGNRRSALDLQRRSLSLQGRLGYEEPGVGRLVFSAYGSGLDRGGDFAHWAQLTNGTDANGRSVGTRTALAQVRLNLDGLLHITNHLDAAFQMTHFRGGLLPQDRVEVASDLFYVKRHQSYYGVDGLAELRWLPSGGFNVVGGVESVYDRENLSPPDRINRDTGTAVLTPSGSPPITLTNLGAYVSSNVKLFDPWLKLTGGLRYDRHSTYGDRTTGRVGLTSRLSKSLVAKLLYGSAFKAPSPYLLYAAPLRPGDVIGNSQLRPQYIHTVEYQMSWKPHRWFGITSGVSHSWLLDKAEFTPQGINQTARNVASQRSLSWETRIDVSYYQDFRAYSSLEVVRSIRNLGQEGYAANLIGTANVVYPNWIARAGGVISVPSLPDVPLQLGSEAMLVGPRRVADTSIVERGESYSLPTYLMLDAFLTTRELYLIPGQESRIALRSRNLLATRGPDPGFSGFEYPLPRGEIFLEFSHVY